MTLRFIAPTFHGVMSSAGASEIHSKPTVFLSYASEDRVAATSIRDAMASAGLDIWYDANELGGGDVWDKKIRQQIRECDYFVAIISAQTEARHEGYFRREWRLAVERTLDMADDHAFLLPIVIDGTDQSVARVPEKFLAVQWLKLPGGMPNPGLSALCARLLSGTMFEKPAPRKPIARTVASTAPFAATPPPVAPPPVATPPVVMPAFPLQEKGQPVKFWVHVLQWAAKSAWITFKRFPRWLQIIVSIWLCFVFVAKGCSNDKTLERHVTIDSAEKLKAIAEKYQGSAKVADVGKLGAEIAREITKDSGDSSGDPKAILAVPFSAPPGGGADAKLADSTFAILYGRLAISHKESVGLSKDTLPSLDSPAALDRGKANHATYIIFGGIENAGPGAALRIEVLKVSDGSVLWDAHYPVAGSDSEVIATEVDAKVPQTEDD